MISFFETSLKSLSVHHTGNKLQDQLYKLSGAPLNLQDEQMKNLLIQFFLKPFEKSNEVFRFMHPSAHLKLNAVYNTAAGIFDDTVPFHAGSETLAKHLYEVCNHPKIKTGEFYVAQFENVQIEGELHDAIGIFKSETKDTYLNVYPDQDGFGISYKEDGISINKLDKGCLILNTEADEGYKVVVFDQSKGGTVFYWHEDFLSLEVRNDSYTKTGTIMGLVKSFVTDKLDEEFDISKAEKIDLLNKSVKYFKEKETFDLAEFSSDVIGSKSGSDLFDAYKKSYVEEYEVEIPDSFEMSSAAVKAKVKAFKSELKLDHNFKVQITGSRELIEKGFDADKSMNFYKLYYKEEQ